MLKTSGGTSNNEAATGRKEGGKVASLATEEPQMGSKSASALATEGSMVKPNCVRDETDEASTFHTGSEGTAHESESKLEIQSKASPGKGNLEPGPGSPRLGGSAGFNAEGTQRMRTSILYDRAAAQK